jgi:hypothetical protein
MFDLLNYGRKKDLKIVIKSKFMPEKTEVSVQLHLKLYKTYK